MMSKKVEVERMLRKSLTAKNKGFFNNKKGVSPLIATVLLIAFAVALGAVVMNWGRSYTEQTAQQVKSKSDVDVKCSLDVKLKLLELSSRPQMCYAEWGASSYVNMTILNDGSKAIAAMNVMLVGDNNIYENKSVANSSISISSGAKVSVPYVYSMIGPLKQVRVTPVAEISGVNTPCGGTGSVLVKDISEIPSCNATY